MTISSTHEEWLAVERGIDPELVAQMGLYSVSRQADHTVARDPKGRILAFPFFRRGEEVAVKYRGPDKVFWQRAGGRKTLYNIDVLEDPALAEGRQALVITEGELDCLTALTAGYPWAVSVPDGAPPPRDKDGNLIKVPDGTDDIEGDDAKYAFLLNDWDQLAKVQRIIIATDADEAGQRLAAELVRRLGRVRCHFVSYPTGCKDLNEVLLSYGAKAVLDVIQRAKPYPISGVYTYRELPPAVPLRPVTTGWGRLDEYLMCYYPALMVVTGFVNQGKSTWAAQLVAQLAIRHGWKIGIGAFEMKINPVVTHQLLTTYLKKPERRWSAAEFARGEDWLERTFAFIAPEPGDEDDHDIDWLISRAEAAVIRQGIRVLLLDPWNEIEHARGRDESMTEYVGRAIRKLMAFAQRYDLLVIVVAHPTKGATKSAAEDLTLYDVADCYSSDTEVLTRRGWLPFAQVALSDDVACFDMERGTMRWDQPTRVVRHAFDGEMARFKGRSVDLLVTPGHRMVVTPGWRDPVGTQAQTGIGRPTRWPKDRWVFAKPSELPRAGFQIPVAPGLPDGAEPERIALDHGYNPDDFVDFIGWYLAEGTISGASVAFSQGKAEGLAELRGLVARMGLDVHDYVSSAVGVHPLATMDCNTLYVRKRHTPQLVNWILEHCGRGSAGMRIPEAIFDLSPRLKLRLLDAFVRGDGQKIPSKRRGEIWTAHTTSPFLRDGFQRIAVECGVSCTVGLAKKVQEHHAASWQLTLVPGRRTIGLDLRNGHLTWERYVGDVWCLTVPTGAFMVRRNGRPAVSGNSANFANKADLGVVVARLGDVKTDNLTGIFVKKVRYQPETGRIGEIELVYDPETRMFGQ